MDDGSVQVTRLLQNPLGQLAEPGDIVRVTDGIGVIYLLPAEFDHATGSEIRYLLAQSVSRQRRASDDSR